MSAILLDARGPQSDMCANQSDKHALQADVQALQVDTCIRLLICTSSTRPAQPSVTNASSPVRMLCPLTVHSGPSVSSACPPVWQTQLQLGVSSLLWDWHTLHEAGRVSCVAHAEAWMTPVKDQGYPTSSDGCWDLSGPFIPMLRPVRGKTPPCERAQILQRQKMVGAGVTSYGKSEQLHVA